MRLVKGVYQLKTYTDTENQLRRIRLRLLRRMRDKTKSNRDTLVIINKELKDLTKYLNKTTRYCGGKH